VKKIKLPKGYDALWTHSEKTNRKHNTKDNLEGFSRFADSEFLKARKAKPDMEKYKVAYNKHQQRKETIRRMMNRLERSHTKENNV